MNKTTAVIGGQPFVSIGALILALVEGANQARDRGVFGDEGFSVVLGVIDSLVAMGDKALAADAAAEPEPVIGQYL